MLIFIVNTFMNQITIACVLRCDEGSRYGPDDVIKLKNGFDRFLSIEHNFVCLSNVENLPITTIPLISESTGWWAKLELFRPDILTGPTFYIDLDMVICSNLDPIIDQCLKSSDFLMLTNHDQSICKDNGAASGVMYWNGDFSYLWNEYIKNPQSWHEEYKKPGRLGDQAFIAERVNWKSFFSVPKIKKTWFTWLDKKMTCSADTKILIGEGKRKPNDPKFQNNPFIKQFWNTPHRKSL
jgi:hypothetical protein